MRPDEAPTRQAAKMALSRTAFIAESSKDLAEYISALPLTVLPPTKGKVQALEKRGPAWAHTSTADLALAHANANCETWI